MKIPIRIRSRAALFAAVALLMLAFASTAFASLGGGASTVEQDRVQMRSAKRAAAQPSSKYTVQEMQTDAGTTVKEFISPQGTVFAVTWQGPVMPDLQQLFGRYYDQFQQAAADRAKAGGLRSRGPMVIQQPGLVVQSGGHMRAYFGKAYLPDMLPEGVKPGDIQ